MQRGAFRWSRQAPKRCWIIGLLAACGLTFRVEVATSAAPHAPALGTPALCARYRGVPDDFAATATAGMIWVAGGNFVPGSKRGYPEERGGSRVPVDGFWIDRTEVTNAQFARFVEATGYVTLAERAGGAPVFRKPTQAEFDRNGSYTWWSHTPGANWRHPAGPGSTIESRANHPVVQIAQADALAYADWLGRSLPTEAQWEYAARANRDSLALHREPRDAHGKALANFWQGDFPVHNTLEDGFETSAPVGCFAPNPFGLFDMLGNVWEWTGSAYTSSHRDEDAHDHGGGADTACLAPAEAGDSSLRSVRLVIKGGSFLCSSNFCARYRVAARHAQEAGQPAPHIGFRTLRAAPR